MTHELFVKESYRHKKMMESDVSPVHIDVLFKNRRREYVELESM